MKSKHIKKETAKRLREGFHTDLMELIEDGIDLYGEKNFERGYQSFFGDAAVHSQRIAEVIKSYAPLIGHTPRKGEICHVLELDDLAKVIEEYFNSLKTE